jgi:hypothetical protein
MTSIISPSIIFPSIISPSDISSYFEKNSALFVEIVKKFDLTKLNNPVIIRFLSYVAQCTDTKYNVAYGGEPVIYDENIWRDHFTDDFWMVLFLFYNYPTNDFRFHHDVYDYSTQLIHLGWFFGRLAFLSPTEIKPFIESKPMYKVIYGNESWCNTTIRDRKSQMLPFSLIGSEQQKDNIPFVSFNMAFMNECKHFNYEEVRKVFIDSFPISAEILNQFIL